MMFELSTAPNNEVSLQSTHAFILKKFAPILSTARSSTSSPLDVEYQSAVEILTFNPDRKHYTPAFLTENVLTAIKQHDHYFGEIFSAKAQEECKHVSLLLQPKPISTFCFVCKEHFADYFKHINHPIHKKHLSASPTEDMIFELVESVQKKRKGPICGFKQNLDLPRKAKKLDQLTPESNILPQISKETSSSNPIFQASKINSSWK